MRLRFAPSPTGQLHVGNARTALFNWLLARAHGGQFILRIEDTDRERSTTASERAILDDLAWLGLTWDEGPDIGGPCGPYRQSERLATYRAWAERLGKSGDAYYCFCTPDEVERDRQAAVAAGEVPRYSGRCRALSHAEATTRIVTGTPAVVRFRVPDRQEFEFDDAVRGHVVVKKEMIGDFVLLRSDGMPAYNFAVVVDDILMEITHVIRGEDHVSNTPRQVMLYDAFGAARPTFAHLSLVLGPDHAPLSKRHGATSVAEFRSRGYLPEAVVNYLALLGWSPGDDQELLPLAELARRFSLASVGKSASVFDFDKLGWVNRHYLKQSAPDRTFSLAWPYLAEAGFVGPDVALERVTEHPEAYAWLRDLAAAGAASVDRLAEIPKRFRCVVRYDVEHVLAEPELASELGGGSAAAVVRALAQELALRGPLDRDAFRAAVGAVKQATGVKGRELFHPIRVALTGQAAGPELDQVVPLIDRGSEVQAVTGASIASCRARAQALAKALAP